MRIVITAGGTREYIDPVRFISNASSGRMGYALARAALKAGHRVTLITGAVALPMGGSLKAKGFGDGRAEQNHPQASLEAATPSGQAKIVKAESAAQMFEAVKKHFSRCDCLIMAAAVADYTPVRPARTKLKKDARTLTIRLKPTRDILKWAGAHKRRLPPSSVRRVGQARALPIAVGFALEDKAVRARAEKKLREKNLDMIIANSPAAIGADKSTIQIKTPGSAWVKVENAAKSTIARKIICLVEELHRPKSRFLPQRHKGRVTKVN